MSTIAFLNGGPEYARDVFAREGRGEWSQGLPIVLEKYGFFDHSSLTVDEFIGRGLPPGTSVVLVAALPAAAWAPVLESLRAQALPVLFGATAPDEVAVDLGVARAEPAEATGSVSVVDAALATRARGFGHLPGGRVGDPVARDVERQPELDWSRIPGVPLDEAQAAAWRHPSRSARRWTLDPGTAVLCEWAPEPGDGTRWPAVLRRGCLRACSFDLFSVLARAHTAEPVERSELRTSARVTGLETLLLGLIDEMLVEAEAVRARVLPWPRGSVWALNVRHDFDRSLDPAYLSEVVAAHAGLGTSATWYWRAQHVKRGAGLRARGSGRTAIRVVSEAARHEIAHHTEQLWGGGAEEQAAIEAAIGVRVRGTSAHGDPTCFRFQGAPNVLWAEERGLLYTELIQHAHFHPHRFLALRADGTVEPSEVICLPHHESFDVSTMASMDAAERIFTSAVRFRATGGFLQVMNHPDINLPSLIETLAALPRGGRLNCTAGWAADWWRRTHVAGQLRVANHGDGRFAVSSEAGVTDAVLELCDPGGTRRLRLLNLDPGASMSVGLKPERAVA